MSTSGRADPAGWAMRGLRPWTVWLWLPCCYWLLIAPLVDGAEDGRGLSSAALTLVAAALFTGAVATRFRPGPAQERIAAALLSLLAVLVVACMLAYSVSWSSAFVLLAIGVGVAVSARLAPYALLLVTAGATVTVLLADGTGDEAFTTGLTVFLSGFGTYAFHALFAVVHELKCTREELARVAVSEERERFARDLHDLLGHTLSVIVVKAEAVRRLIPHDSGAAAGHAADIESIGREALADVRRAASGYRGAGLERELSRARSALDAAGVTLAVDRRRAAPGALPDDTDALLGWVVREGVTNVLRHSQATGCIITVDRYGDTIELSIDDDGPSIEGIHQLGAGLRGLEERVVAHGGQLHAVRVDPGFRLRVEVPAVSLPAVQEAASR